MEFGIKIFGHRATGKAESKAEGENSLAGCLTQLCK
jgi:hypothetical protein